MSQLDVIEISSEIQKKIKLLETMRVEIKKRGDRKAETEAEYDKQIALTIIKLSNGVEMQFENQIISEPKMSVIEKIAKGICWEYKLAMEKADAEYKSIISNIDAVKSEVNALQSIFKNLENM